MGTVNSLLASYEVPWNENILEFFLVGVGGSYVNGLVSGLDIGKLHVLTFWVLYGRKKPKLNYVVVSSLLS